MAMSSFIIVLLIFVLSAVVIMRPFLEPQKKGKTVSSGKYDALLAERERLYSSIEELDLALELNKISSEDHTQSRELLMDQAALVLAQLDKIGGKPKKQKISDQTSDIDDDLEQMIRTRREKISKDRSKKCPKCAEPVGSKDQFCRKCGETL